MKDSEECGLIKIFTIIEVAELSKKNSDKSDILMSMTAKPDCRQTSSLLSRSHLKKEEDKLFAFLKLEGKLQRVKGNG